MFNDNESLTNKTADRQPFGLSDESKSNSNSRKKNSRIIQCHIAIVSVTRGLTLLT